MEYEWLAVAMFVGFFRSSSSPKLGKLHAVAPLLADAKAAEHAVEHIVGIDCTDDIAKGI